MVLVAMGRRDVHTLVKAVLVRLALCAAAGSVVDLVHEATAAAGLLLAASSSSLLAFLVTAGEVLDEIHVEGCGWGFCG